MPLYSLPLQVQVNVSTATQQKQYVRHKKSISVGGVGTDESASNALNHP